MLLMIGVMVVLHMVYLMVGLAHVQEELSEENYGSGKSDNRYGEAVGCV